MNTGNIGRHFICALAILILSGFGTYFLISELLKLITVHFPGNNILKMIIAIFLPIFIGLFNNSLMLRYVLSDIKIYPLLVELSKKFSNSDDKSWKMLFKIVILKILKRSKYRVKVSLENYVNICIGGAHLATKSWNSTYVGNLENWGMLRYLLREYVEKIQSRPEEMYRKKYIITSPNEIESYMKENSSRNFTYKDIKANEVIKEVKNDPYFIFSDSYFVATKSTTDIVSYGNGIDERFPDFSMFDDMLVIAADREKFHNKLNRIEKKRERKKWEEKIYKEKLCECKIPIYIIIKAEQNEACPDFEFYKEKLEQLESIPLGQQRSKIKYDEDKKIFYKCNEKQEKIYV